MEDSYCEECNRWTAGVRHTECEQRVRNRKIKPEGDTDPRFAYYSPGHVLIVGDWYRDHTGWNGPITRYSCGKGTTCDVMTAHYTGGDDRFDYHPPLTHIVTYDDCVMNEDGTWSFAEEEHVGKKVNTWTATQK